MSVRVPTTVYDLLAGNVRLKPKCIMTSVYTEEGLPSGLNERPIAREGEEREREK